MPNISISWNEFKELWYGLLIYEQCWYILVSLNYGATL